MTTHSTRSHTAFVLVMTTAMLSFGICGLLQTFEDHKKSLTPLSVSDISTLTTEERSALVMVALGYSKERLLTNGDLTYARELIRDGVVPAKSPTTFYEFAQAQRQALLSHSPIP